MRKRLLLLLLAILVLFSATACSGRLNNDQESPDATNQESVHVVDHLGRTVSVDKKPERIVSGYYISTSALIALGLADKLVGIEAKANTRPIYSLAAPKLLDLPNVGTAKEFDLEGCLSLEPNLVILPIKLKDQIKTLEDMNVKVIGVNPESQDLLNEMITMIARLTGIKDYNEMLGYYEEKERELKTVHETTTEKPRVYLAGNSSMLSTATKNMYQNNLIETAGGINVAAVIDGSHWANISYEQLVQYNPDCIIIVPEANYSREDVLKDSNLTSLSAIKNNRVYQMPSEFEAWDAPVPSGILGKIWLTSILYPNKYFYDKFVDEVYSFYKKFYNFEIDKEALRGTEGS